MVFEEEQCIPSMNDIVKLTVLHILHTKKNDKNLENRNGFLQVHRAKFAISQMTSLNINSEMV